MTTTPDAAARHTPEPWRAQVGTHRIGTNKLCEIIASANPTAIVGWPGFDDSNRPFDEHAANAARIVACVNALAGIADPAQHLAAQSSRIAVLEGALRQVRDGLHIDLVTDSGEYPLSRIKLGNYEKLLSAALSAPAAQKAGEGGGANG